MTRRLIMIDMTLADYKRLRMGIEFLGELSGGPANKKRWTSILKMIDEAWNAKGREGSGNNTKQRISDQ